MRSSCAAFFLFAIYLSSSSYASSIVRRDGRIAFPTAGLENVESNSNYPTEGTSDPSQPQVPDVPAPVPGSSGPESKHITDAQGKIPPPVADQGVKKDTPSNYPAGSPSPSNYPTGTSPPDDQPSSIPNPPHETAKDPTQGGNPPVTPPPAVGDNKPNTTAPWSPPAASDKPQSTPAPVPPKADSPAPPADSPAPPAESPAPPPAGHPTTPAANSTSPPTDASPATPAPGNGQDTGNKPSPSPSATKCSTYLDANTDHAACGPEGTPTICNGGCTGAIVAQLCQLNETSPDTTETCTNAYREVSATVHVCINDAGAFSCRGPATGSVTCNGCSSGQDGNSTAGSGESSPGSGSSNETTPGSPGGDSGNSAGAFVSPFHALLASAFTLAGGALLL